MKFSKRNYFTKTIFFTIMKCFTKIKFFTRIKFLTKMKLFIKIKFFTKITFFEYKNLIFLRNEIVYKKLFRKTMKFSNKKITRIKFLQKLNFFEKKNCKNLTRILKWILTKNALQSRKLFAHDCLGNFFNKKLENILTIFKN